MNDKLRLKFPLIMNCIIGALLGLLVYSLSEINFDFNRPVKELATIISFGIMIIGFLVVRITFPFLRKDQN
jgi:amino acid transporter